MIQEKETDRRGGDESVKTKHNNNKKMKKMVILNTSQNRQGVIRIRGGEKKSKTPKRETERESDRIHKERPRGEMFPLGAPPAHPTCPPPLS